MLCKSVKGKAYKNGSLGNWAVGSIYGGLIVCSYSPKKKKLFVRFENWNKQKSIAPFIGMLINTK